MIRLVGPRLSSLFWEQVEGWGIFGTKLYAQARIYGLWDGPLEVWLLMAEDRPVGAVSRLEGAFCVAAQPDAPLEELAEFVSLAGGRCLEGPQPLVQRLAETVGGRLESSWILRAGRLPLSQLCERTGESQPCRAQQLDPVRQLHALATPGFPRGEEADAWLVDASYRHRHGYADFYIQNKNSEVISTICILFKGASRCILGAMATHPAHRGRGYGGQMVRHALLEAAGQGLEPWLFTADDPLLDFYQPLGFAQEGRWGRLWFPH